MTKISAFNRDRVKLERLERALGYTFADRNLLIRALTHRSHSGVHYERLEFLGDSILSFIIARDLYAQEQRADEGRLTRLRASLVREETLAQIAREYKLGDYLYMGSGEYRSGSFQRDSILADVFEAVIAAIYLDGGIEKISNWLQDCFAKRLIGASEMPTQKDPKSRLQELMQGQGLPLPNYAMCEVSGMGHEQSFTVSCDISQPVLRTTGQGSSRRKAEQAAALNLLNELERKDG